MINEQYNNVEKLLIEREHTLEEFKHLEIQLKSLNTTRSNLTKRLAEGEISSSAFEKARDDLELEIKDIEEHLWKIRIQLFKDEYEKPF
jgi:predicted  nucleic acid-binding Zn-ribbon protein